MFDKPGIKYIVEDAHGNRAETFRELPENAMKTPTQEQLNDPDYWNIVAPDWAESYGVVGIDRSPVWFSLKQYAYWENGKTFQYGVGCCFGLGDIEWQASRPNPQPAAAKPESQEWDGEEWPVPVGQRCAITFVSGAFDTYEQPVIAVLQDGDVTVFRDGCSYHGIHKAESSRVRPLKTQAEREKEATIEFAQEVINSFPISETDTAEKALSKLYDAGLLRKGGE